MKQRVIALGFFDGVHLGHAYLAEQLNQIAKEEKLKSAFFDSTQTEI